MKTLSDKEQEHLCEETKAIGIRYFSREDVKEFIRKLKEEVEKRIDFIDITDTDSDGTAEIKARYINDNTDFIDELVGDKLSKPTEEKE